MNTYYNKILEQFFDNHNWTVSKGASGMNNTTRFVNISGKNYVLRVYNTHNDMEKVECEMTVLNALNERNLHFFVPFAMRTLNGKMMAIAEDGKLAVLFKYLKGKNPVNMNSEKYKQMGILIGSLTNTLKTVDISNPKYYPYYELEKSYPDWSLDYIISYCENPDSEFVHKQKELLLVAKHLKEYKNQMPHLRMLPHQLIHGDINTSNVLENDDGVIDTILDYEFVTYDLRVMELAVCLSEIIDMGVDYIQIQNNIQAFIEGYSSNITLEESEINAIPKLIMLRRLDVFIHFLNRHWKNISTEGRKSAEIVSDCIDAIINQDRF